MQRLVQRDAPFEIGKQPCGLGGIMASTSRGATISRCPAMCRSLTVVYCLACRKLFSGIGQSGLGLQHDRRISLCHCAKTARNS